jgi:hypothetical protein
VSFNIRINENIFNKMVFPKFNSSKLLTRQMILALPKGDSLRTHFEGVEKITDAFKKMKADGIKPVISMKMMTPLISQQVKPALSVLDTIKREDISLQKIN